MAGIVTEQDIRRRMAYRAEADTPVDRVMSAPVETIEADDYLYRAIARMRQRDLRHIPVMDGSGTVLGNLELHRALAAASAATMDLIDRLTREDDLDGLFFWSRRCKSKSRMRSYRKGSRRRRCRRFSPTSISTSITASSVCRLTP